MNPDVPVMEGENVTVHFGRRVRGRRRTIRALDAMDITIHQGETVSLVGESGSGKSTAGRALLGAVALTDGRIRFRGQDVTGLKGHRWRTLRQDMQLVFQDPYSALDPKQTVFDALAEPLVVHRVARGAELQRRVHELLDLVGFPASAATRYPHAFSGGQRQRIVIARALALRPGFLVADEATAALDVSIQAQIVNLLTELQDDLGLSYLVISHNLAVVRHMADRVAIMYLGRVVEVGTADEIYDGARHPYTEALLQSVPVPDPSVRRTSPPISGDVPSALDPPPGCRFHTRCPLAQERCRREVPPMTAVSSDHMVACWVRSSASADPSDGAAQVARNSG